MKIHDLKTLPKYFNSVLNGKKKFEVRKDDRGGFQINDILLLQEYKPKVYDSEKCTIKGSPGKYTRREIAAKVTYVLSDGSFVKAGYAIMSIEVLCVSDDGISYTRENRGTNGCE